MASNPPGRRQRNVITQNENPSRRKRALANRAFLDCLSRPRALVAATLFAVLAGSAVVVPERLLAQDDAQEIAENSALGDAMRGMKVFRKCQTCHTLDPDGPNRIGPNLAGVVNRDAGAVEGYKYSAALIERAEAGLVWNDENLDAYLRKPREFLKGGKMVFAGLRKEQDRLDVIAYMREAGEK